MAPTKLNSDHEHTHFSGFTEVAAEQFGKYVAAYQNRLFRFILKMVSRVSVAEELTQEAFLRAYRNIGSFKGNSSFFTWLAGIALNLDRNHLKRSDEGRHDIVSGEGLLQGVASGDDPLEAYEKKEFLEDLHRAITGLPPELREALVLVSLEGFSYGEAAQAMGVSEGTVKCRVFRARERLRERMKGKLSP